MANQQLARRTLQGDPGLSRWRQLLSLREIPVALSVAALLGAFVLGWFTGTPIPARWVNVAGDMLGWHSYGVLNGDLSVKPPGWDGKDLSSVKGAKLSGRWLRGLKAQSVFAVNSDFTFADLHGAYLQYADLRGADFYGADLADADLSQSDLRGVEFQVADVFGASFAAANLEGAELQLAARIEPVQVRQTYNWFLAELSPDAPAQLCTTPKDCIDHKDRLRRKDYSGLDLQGYSFFQPDLSGANLRRSLLPDSLDHANLSKADLRGADFSHVDLAGANLEGADLRGSDLTYAEGLTRSQIESALTDVKTELPPRSPAGMILTPLRCQSMIYTIAAFHPQCRIRIGSRAVRANWAHVAPAAPTATTVATL